MTREEQAQYIFEKLMENPEFRKVFVDAITDAANEAEKVIKALQPEPCGDAISRQAVLDLPRIKTHNVWGNVIHESVDVEDIRQLPPVTPAEKVGQWIPVSERLPERGQVVLWCNEFGSVFTSAITYQDSYGYSVGQHRGDMIAWMPLPEPYKASPTGAERTDKE